MINVPSRFHSLAQGQVIHPISELYISFDKTINDSTKFFTLDESVLDGPDLLKSSGDNPIQLWDLYNYANFTDRLVSVDVERSIEFPYDTQVAQADITLDNTDKYFTPGSGSTISDDNLPRRPLKIYAGYKGETVVPQFVGLTQDMPNVNDARATAEYYATDFLSEIANMTLTEVVAMRDVTTDVVLAEIVEQFGVLPSQYNFEPGDNVIPFVFFDIGQNAGEAIRKLVQAEGGKFWLDEEGILRFQKRYTATTDPVISLDDYQIISVTPSDTADIVNRVKINCDLREVQEFQTVYTKSPSGDSVSANLWVIAPGQSITRECRLEDPCYDVVTPTLGHATSVSWFTAKTSTGTDVTTGVTATGALSTNAFTVTFTNANVFPVEIDELVLWGEPAKVYDVLDYDSYEDVSLAEYGEHKLEITDNQFFQSYGQAKAFAVYMLRDRAFYQSILTIRVKGDFSLQLGDIIHLDGQYEGDYKVDACKWHLEAGLLDTEITVHKFTPLTYFTLNQSKLDGTDVLA